MATGNGIMAQLDTHTTFDFRIDSLSPETLPMLRLAEYVTCLGKLMGSDEHVHLLKVRSGSAIPEILVGHVAEPKVLDGVVIRVGGKDSTISVWQQGEGGQTLECNATRAIAKRLAAYLFQSLVRVAGNAKWQRTKERVWDLAGFHIKSFESLDQTSLDELVTKLRAIGTDWSLMDGPEAELRQFRRA